MGRVSKTKDERNTHMQCNLVDKVAACGYMD